MAFGSDVVAIARVKGAMVRVKLAFAVCAGEPESVTLKPSGVLLTWAVGVPLICPVAAFRLKPLGRVPEINCQVYEPVPPVAGRGCGDGPFAATFVSGRGVGGGGGGGGGQRRMS